MWNKIIIEESPAVMASDAEIRAFEKRMQIALPPDQQYFLKTLGEGVLYNHFRIFGLDKIEDEAQEFQRRWQEYFLWNSPDSALVKDHMANCIIVGDTFNGDELALSRDYPLELFYFPQDLESIVKLGSSLEQAISSLAHKLATEIEGYPEDERDEWDLRPVFNRESF